jgi:indolepyruvate ferredoxin oxidoreductase alpha subunit
MTTAMTAPAATRLLLSGNEAIARGAWESGVKVATSYPGTPATEILEAIGVYPDLHAQFSVNEKVAMEIAIGAAMSGVRAICSMKHVGMNVASDAFMTYTLTGTKGGLVIVVADDVGLSSSQNEQDSRYWGRFGHMPILEPADSQEAYEMTKAAFEISERFLTPVILRATTRVCHVKAMATVGERIAPAKAEFVPEPQRWVMVPGNAKNRLPLMAARDVALKSFAEETDLTVIDEGSDRRVGFVTSGPVAMNLRETFPDAPILKLGFTHPLPIGRIKAFAATVDTWWWRGNRAPDRERTEGRRSCGARQGLAAVVRRTFAPCRRPAIRPCSVFPPRRRRRPRPSCSRARRPCVRRARIWPPITPWRCCAKRC